MSSRLMIFLTTISIVGSSFASGAFAAPYREAGKARYFSAANASNEWTGAGYAAFAGADQSDYGFGSDASWPRYHGGPKGSY
jgi:hypothetical protein